VSQREMSELSEPTRHQPHHATQPPKSRARCQKKNEPASQNKLTIIISAQARTVQCKLVRTKGIELLLPNQGGEILKVVLGATDRSCHAEQVGQGAVKRWAMVLDKKDSKSSASDEESEESREESRREWLAKFSTMKVGPPKRCQVCNGQANTARDIGRGAD